MKYRNWWIAWSLISPLSLVVGMVLSVIPTIVLLALFQVEPEALLKRTILESIVGILTGLGTGMTLGFVQERLLRRYLPRLRFWKWVTLLPWLVEFAIAPWLQVISRNQSLYSNIAQSLDGMAVARYFPILMVGLWTSGMQAVLLRRYFSHAERWMLMGIGWYGLAFLFSSIDFTVGMIASFAIANGISGWFLARSSSQ